jgi:hypothetical protein
MEITFRVTGKVLPWQSFLLSTLLVCVVLASDGRCCGYCMLGVQIHAYIPLLCARISTKQTQPTLHSRPAAEKILKSVVRYQVAMDCLDNNAVTVSDSNG